MIRIFTLIFSLLFIFHSSIYAHGSLETPISRLYNCYKENPENPKSAACRAAVAAGGTQALYDWNGLNQGAANDQHQRIIPDGKICSAGRSLFKGMDLARTDWPTTTIMPNSNGRFDFIWYATAPHATKYFKFYITKPEYNFSLPLKWSDLEALPFCTITNVTLTNGRYKMNCPFPTGGGKRTIFLIWQRSDSAEAFYACSDVVLATQTQNTWKLLDDFYTNINLELNTKVIFRLFKGSTEIATYDVQMGAGQLEQNKWPYYLAQDINNKSILIHIGQLDQNGQVIPVQSATLNKIYINDPNPANYHFAIDFITPNEQVDYIYPDGISNYKAGTIVLGFNQKRYQCKPFPYSGWCSQSPTYYEPGKGLAWQQAWDLLPDVVA